MEIAKLVLEYLRVLLWPAVTLTIILMFAPHLGRILQQLSERVGTAETLKVGVMGQEVQISGTAKELAKERTLLAQSSDPQIATKKIEAIDQATRELADPIADLIGLKLLQSKGVVRLEGLVHAALAALDPDKQPSELPQMVIMAVTRSVDQILASLRTLGYVIEAKQDEYELTDAGRRFFQRVSDRQSDFMARFRALK
jgi:hypothetical protein